MNLLPVNLGTLATLAAKETARYAVNGVSVTFDHDGTYTAVATNGRYMGIATGPAPDAEDYPASPAVRNAPNSLTSAIIPTKEWQAAFKSMPKPRGRITGEPPIYSQYIACVPSLTTTVLASTDTRGTDSVATVDNVEGRFPDWRQVVPNAAPESTVHINPKYLLDLLKVALSYTDSDNQRITLELRGKDTPIVVRVKGKGGQQFTGLLMPVK